MSLCLFQQCSLLSITLMSAVYLFQNLIKNIKFVVIPHQCKNQILGCKPVITTTTVVHFRILFHFCSILVLFKTWWTAWVCAYFKGCGKTCISTALTSIKPLCWCNRKRFRPKNKQTKNKQYENNSHSLTTTKLHILRKQKQGNTFTTCPLLNINM